MMRSERLLIAVSFDPAVGYTAAHPRKSRRVRVALGDFSGKKEGALELRASRHCQTEHRSAQRAGLAKYVVYNKHYRKHNDKCSVYCNDILTHVSAGALIPAAARPHRAGTCRIC